MRSLGRAKRQSRALDSARHDRWVVLEMTVDVRRRGGALRPQPRGLIVGYVVILAAASAGITTSGVSTGIASGITALA